MRTIWGVARHELILWLRSPAAIAAALFPALGMGVLVALMTVSVFFMYLTGNTYWAIILDTIEKGRVGGVSGFVHLIANLAGIVAPAATGYMVQASGSFTSAFVLTGAIAVLGALSVAVFVRPPATEALRPAVSRA